MEEVDLSSVALCEVGWPHDSCYNSCKGAFWMALKEQFAEWASALIIVKPETVVRWRRDAFRRHWAKKSARPSGLRSRSVRSVEIALNLPS